MWHRDDPMGLRVAAVALGRLVGRGEVSAGFAREAARQWAADHVGSGAQHQGLSIRLCWGVFDTARAERLARANADVAVRWAVRPLFRAQASASAIEEAAGRAGGGVLDWPEVAAILGEELAAVRGRRRA